MWYQQVVAGIHDEESQKKLQNISINNSYGEKTPLFSDLKKIMCCDNTIS